MIIALGLPLNIATIILGFIFSVQFNDFRARGSITITTPTVVAVTEYFHADAEINVNPWPVSGYLISLPWMYLCSCMHIMSMLWSIAEAVTSGNLPILFKVQTLNVTVCIVVFHFSKFCFSLSSVDDFSNTGARAPAWAGRTPFFTRPKSDVVWTSGLSVSW